MTDTNTQPVDQAHYDAIMAEVDVHAHPEARDAYYDGIVASANVAARLAAERAPVSDLGQLPVHVDGKTFTVVDVVDDLIWTQLGHRGVTPGESEQVAETIINAVRTAIAAAKDGAE